MACWYLAGVMRLRLEPRPHGRGNRRLEFLSSRSDGDLLFEVKAPAASRESDIYIGDGADILQRALVEANSQFEKGRKNILVLVPSTPVPIFVNRRQIVRAFIAEEVIRLDLDLEGGTLVNPRHELDPRGRFTRLWKNGGAPAPRYRRVGLVLSLEWEYFDRADFNAAIARERFYLPNTVLIKHNPLAVHNPYAEAPIGRELFAHVPQLFSDTGPFQWSDGKRAM